MRLSTLTFSIAFLLAVASAGLHDRAAAQRTAPANDEASTASSYLTPFPEGDVYRLHLYGDAFAEGLHGGLADAFANDARVQVQKKVRTIGPLIRPEWEDEVRAEEVSRDLAHIAVVMLGLYDRQIIRQPNAKPLSIGSEEWQTEYGRRLDRWLKALKKRNIAVYVVGQPVLRDPRQQAHAETLNEVMREKAQSNGIRFIDIMETFQDESGNFSQFGPDLSGNRQKQREGDGVTFTTNGNRKLAHFVERDIRRDVQQAAADRAVPLAGNEAEQKRIGALRAGAASAAVTPARGALTLGKRASSATRTEAPPPPAIAEGVVDQKADNGRIVLRIVGANGREDQIPLDIVRPAIPATVISLLTRRDAAERAPSQPAETMADDLGGGLLVTSAVSSLGDAAAGGSPQRRRIAAGQAAYVAVLVKGERPTPKPGRADDFRWPRNDAALPEPVPASAVAPRPPTGGAALPAAKPTTPQAVPAKAPKAIPGPANR